MSNLDRRVLDLEKAVKEAASFNRMRGTPPILVTQSVGNGTVIQLEGSDEGYARITRTTGTYAVGAPQKYNYVRVLRRVDPQTLTTFWLDNWDYEHSQYLGDWPDPICENNGRPDVPVDGSAIVKLIRDEFGNLTFSWEGEREITAFLTSVLHDTSGGTGIITKYGWKQCQESTTNLSWYNYGSAYGLLEGTTTDNYAIEFTNLPVAYGGNVHVKLWRGGCSGYPHCYARRWVEGNGSSVYNKQIVHVYFAKSGTFTLTLTDPTTGNTYTTSALAYNISAAAMETALQALGGPFTAFTVTAASIMNIATGTQGDYRVEFNDSYANYPTIYANYSSLKSNQLWYFTTPVPPGTYHEALYYYTSLAAHTRTNDIITASANGAIAGPATTIGQRILLNKSSSLTDNGIYTVTQVGSGGTPFILTRAADFNSNSGKESGSMVYVTNDTTYWVLKRVATAGAGADHVYPNTDNVEFVSLPFGYNPSAMVILYTTTAADPTTTEIAANKAGIHKNTTSGDVFFAYNDAGVIKKVLLT